MEFDVSLIEVSYEFDVKIDGRNIVFHTYWGNMHNYQNNLWLF
jgi:hypothetical protein